MRRKLLEGDLYCHFACYFARIAAAHSIRNDYQGVGASSADICEGGDCYLVCRNCALGHISFAVSINANENYRDVVSSAVVVGGCDQSLCGAFKTVPVL